MIYNPYDLVEMVINKQLTYGRPFEFDSEIVNQKLATNAFGNLVKPTKLSTTCPDCGQGLIVTVRLGMPPFAPVVYSCPTCFPLPTALVDPFTNPLSTGRVPYAALDPLLHDLSKPLTPVENTVATQRFEGLQTQLAKQVVTRLEESDLVTEKVTAPILEAAEGVGEECDFGDAELFEDE